MLLFFCADPVTCCCLLHWGLREPLTSVFVPVWRVSMAGGGRAPDPVNPKPFLASLVGSPVVVRLKWGMEYRGRLTSTDAYFNVLLGDAEEWVGGAMAGRIGEVLIRCNNVLFIRAGTENSDEDEATAMAP